MGGEEDGKSRVEFDDDLATVRGGADERRRTDLRGEVDEDECEKNSKVRR